MGSNDDQPRPHACRQDKLAGRDLTSCQEHSVQRIRRLPVDWIHHRPAHPALLRVPARHSRPGRRQKTTSPMSLTPTPSLPVGYGVTQAPPAFLDAGAPSRSTERMDGRHHTRRRLPSTFGRSAPDPDPSERPPESRDRRRRSQGLTGQRHQLRPSNPDCRHGPRRRQCRGERVAGRRNRTRGHRRRPRCLSRLAPRSAGNRLTSPPGRCRRPRRDRGRWIPSDGGPASPTRQLDSTTDCAPPGRRRVLCRMSAGRAPASFLTSRVRSPPRAVGRCRRLRRRRP